MCQTATQNAMIATYLGRLSQISAIGAFGILPMTSCDLNLKTDNAYKLVSSTDSNASMQVHTYELENGLTIIGASQLYLS